MHMTDDVQPDTASRPLNASSGQAYERSEPVLLILTGNVQTGKTRWLQNVIAHLEKAGVSCQGVLAPGTWIEKADGSFEKTGIDNVLLPSHEIVPFARRSDLAQKDGLFDAESQAGRARLKWHISDDAIARVNEHLHALRECSVEPSAGNEHENRPDGAGASTCEPPNSPHETSVDLHAPRRRAGVQASTPSPSDARPLTHEGAARKAVLFIDELGQLELLHDGGLTEAVALLEQGPRGRYEHAVVIARDKFDLPEHVEQRFGEKWGGSARIMPDEGAWRTWIEPLLEQA